jgi:hypothetical protein
MVVLGGNNMGLGMSCRRFAKAEINSRHGKGLQTEPIGDLMGRQALTDPRGTKRRISPP